MPAVAAPVAVVHNRRDVIQACIPGAGAVMSARAGARFFAMLANGGCLDGVRLLAEDTVRAMTQPRPNPAQIDRTLAGGAGIAPPIGIGGYWLADPVGGPGPNLLCHGGSGGSIGWADLDRSLGATICHNACSDAIGPTAVARIRLPRWARRCAVADEAASDVRSAGEGSASSPMSGRSGQ
jgi:CubicO group peptidase (beta-lactamase class C family)